MTQPRRIAWPDFPIVIGASVTVLAGLLLIINLVMGAAFNGKQMKLCPALTGAVLVEKIPISVGNLLNGRYESSLAKRIGTHEPYYPLAVRVANQVNYSLFNQSSIPAVVVGKHRELLEQAYIADYCTRDVPAFMAGAPAWAKKIRQMQNIVEQHRQSFLYVLTPSKVAQYPEFLPAGMPCPSTEVNRIGLLPAWAALVQQNGIHLTNTINVLWNAHGKYPFMLYPRGGTHWNSVGGALASQAVEASLQTQRQNGLFTPFNFTWKLSSNPHGVDTDLASLMNLLWKPDNYTVPDIAVTQALAPAGCRPLRVVIIGGSFMHNVGAAFSRLPCVSHVVEYEYWSAYHITWNDGAMTIDRTVSPAMRDADLQSADVILYEENEQLLGHSRHGTELYGWLTEHQTRQLTAK